MCLVLGFGLLLFCASNNINAILMWAMLERKNCMCNSSTNNIISNGSCSFQIECFYSFIHSAGHTNKNKIATDDDDKLPWNICMKMFCGFAVDQIK